MKITLSQIRVFEAVARTGSMSKAAEELRITQPSVSTQLRAFENHAKGRLITRNGHTISLTRLGRIVLPKARALLGVADDIEGVLASELNLETGLLRLGYSAHQFAMPLISAFMTAHPGIKIETRSMASLDLLKRLRDGLIDVALVTATNPPSGLHAVELRRDEIVLMAPRGHPLAKARRGKLSWEDIAPYPLIRREETSGTRIIFDAAAARTGISLKTSLDLGSWESMRAGVISGIGVGVAMMGETEETDLYAVMRIDDASLRAIHYAACLPELSTVAAVEAFFGIVANVKNDVSATRAKI